MMVVDQNDEIETGIETVVWDHHLEVEAQTSTHTSQVTGITSDLPDPEMRDHQEKKDHETIGHHATTDPETTVHLRVTNTEDAPLVAEVTVHREKESSSEIATEITIETGTIVGEVRMMHGEACCTWFACEALLLGCGRMIPGVFVV